MTIRVKDFIPLTTLIIISYTFVSLYFLRSLSTNTGDFLRYAILDFYGDRISDNTLLDTNNIFGFLKQFIADPSIIGLKLIDIIVGPNNQDYASRITRLTLFSFINYYFYLFTVYSKSAKYKFICTLGAISTLSVDLFFGQLRNSYAFVVILMIIWVLQSRKIIFKFKFLISILLSFLSLALHLSSAFIIPYLLLILMMDLRIKRKNQLYFLFSAIILLLSNLAFSFYNSSYGRTGYESFSGINFLIFAVICFSIIYFYRKQIYPKDLFLSFTLSLALINTAVITSQSARFISMILPILIIYTSNCERRIPSLLFLLLSLIYSTYRIIS